MSSSKTQSVGVGGTMNTTESRRSNTNDNDVLDTILQSSDFSVAWYFNTAIVGSSQDHQQKRMAELALQLQLETQKCHEEIGKIGIELQAIMPRCSADIGRVCVGLNGLKMDAEQLLYESSGTGHPNDTNKTNDTAADRTVKKKTSISEKDHDNDDANHNNNNIPYYSSMETLSILHALQSNLIRTKEILTAAATWDKTVSSIITLLSSNNNTNNSATSGLHQAVQCLVQLEQGERALRGMPNPEERYESIGKLRQQVSSLLQPQLKYALSNMPSSTSSASDSSKVTSSLQQCVQLYSQLNQMETFTSEYVKHRPVVNGIHKLWFEYKPSIIGSGTTDGSSSFGEWLPTWLDAVLSLITEERRHCTSIFAGTHNKQQQPNYSNNLLEAVPGVIIRVFAECFRPILPSFKSRLESIYSSSGGKVSSSGVSDSGNTSATAQVTTPGGSSSSKGSLNDISNVYESMLQFLSLVYETITGGWVDMVESGSIQIVTNNQKGNSQQDAGQGIVINNPPTLYKELTKVFVQLMSPFAAYQKNLGQLETKYMNGQVQLLTRQIQQVATTVLNNDSATSGWETLQEVSMEELLVLSNKIIPIAEGAVARFELLNGGYSATSALQVIDRVLAGYASELALAVHSLSSLTTVDDKNGANYNLTTVDDKNGANYNFDETHVLCALQALKIAGSYSRAVQSLRNKTRERLQLLSERMTAHMTREKLLDDAFQKLLIGGKITFQLPDSISIVEIDSILVNAIFAEGDDANKNETPASTGPTAVTPTASSTALERLANIISGDSLASMYPESDSSSKQLATSCHTFVFDVCFAVPRFYLNGMSSMVSWKEQNSILESWGSTSSSYGTLPQPFITHIGEHMLALVQALEPFASDLDALNVSNEVMDIETVRRVAYQFWLDFITAATGNAGTDSLVKTLMDGKGMIEFVIGAIPIEDDSNHDGEDGKEEGDDAHDAASTAFCNKWLDVVGLAVTGRLLERIMRIPSLTPKGCEHLNADLGYVVNVFSALGISGHPHPLLGHLAELCILDKDVVTERINSLDRSDVSSDFLRSVEERLSAMRGLHSKY